MPEKDRPITLATYSDPDSSERFRARITADGVEIWQEARETSGAWGIVDPPLLVPGDAAAQLLVVLAQTAADGRGLVSSGPVADFYSDEHILRKGGTVTHEFFAFEPACGGHVYASAQVDCADGFPPDDLPEKISRALRAAVDFAEPSPESVESCALGTVGDLLLSICEKSTLEISWARREPHGDRERIRRRIRRLP